MVDLLNWRHQDAVLSAPTGVWKVCRRGYGFARLGWYMTPDGDHATWLMPWRTLAWTLVLILILIAALSEHASAGVSIAALPTITFNLGTGSDANSGAGPATPLTGSNAAITNTVNTVTLSVDAPDLSGIATDGSAVIRVTSSAGVSFNKITNVDNVTKVVTCARNFGATDAADAWGIGGKLSSIDSTACRKLFQADVQAGWGIKIEADDSFTSTVTPTTGGAGGTGPIWFYGDSATTRRMITQTANAATFTLNASAVHDWRFENLTFANSNGTKTSANAFSLATSATNCCLVYVNCATDPTNKQLRFLTRTSSMTPLVTMIGCDINSCTGTNQIDSTSNSQQWTVIGCVFRNGSGGGLKIDNGVTFNITGNLFYANAGVHLTLAETGTWTATGKTITYNVFDGATGANSGIDFSGAATTSNLALGLVCHSNLLTNNGTSGSAYGVNGKSNLLNDLAFSGYNDYFGNRTSATNNFTSGGTTTFSGLNDQTTDPGYISSATGNFAIGIALRALGFPDSTYAMARIASGTFTFEDIGAAQRQEPTPPIGQYMGIRNVGTF